MWNEVKTNLSSTKVYLKEFLFFVTILIFLLFFIVENKIILITVIALILLFGLIFLNFIGYKRNRELKAIESVILGIRNNTFNQAEEIKLKENLRSLQEEIKQMFEKERNDIEYLKRLERMRTEFLANVSHELRTPIFAIQGYIETLLNGAIDDEKVNKNFLDKANQHTINLSNLLNDLIDISMIESGEMRMSYRYFNINDYFGQITHEMMPIAQEKGIELIYHPAKEGLQLFGDKNRLKQVFINLITNAIKYTEKGKVEVLIEEEPKYGKIIIRDTGIGIPPEDINRIFERFYRVDKARSRAVGGTGLGLAIVKHIIEAHNSKIEVKSELGVGSEFSFMLKK
ncbi:MAG: two-component sensor histidine kinase [Ignavibacteria bacterium RBG_16_34_14]|nr:MAG: two-component sensor histidine kinase [Ignavibacteria bacterium RBG_16_34_14]